jgi:hypothetical protein
VLRRLGVYGGRVSKIPAMREVSAVSDAWLVRNLKVLSNNGNIFIMNLGLIIGGSVRSASMKNDFF